MLRQCESLRQYPRARMLLAVLRQPLDAVRLNQDVVIQEEQVGAQRSAGSGIAGGGRSGVVSSMTLSETGNPRARSSTAPTVLSVQLLATTMTSQPVAVVWAARWSSVRESFAERLRVGITTETLKTLSIRSSVDQAARGRSGEWVATALMRTRRAGFALAAMTRLRKYLYYRYLYSFTPSQLCFLVNCLDRTAAVEGSVVEIGCAFGHTTVFLDQHLTSRHDARRYICIDTFSGFTTTDVAFEEAARGKDAASYARSFTDANLVHFRRTLANNGVTRVSPIRADINTFDTSVLGQISFCLIDVDLYLPVKSAIDKVLPQMSPGGIIVVDDCREHRLWDGALQAYEEFVEHSGLHSNIVEGQFGVIEINA